MIKEITEDYKNFWAYKEVSKNWESKVTEKSVIIYFDKKKNDIYAKFTFKYDEPWKMWLVYLEGELISDELEFYSTYEEVVRSCFYFFYSRF